MAPPAKKAKTSKSNDKPTMPGPIIFKVRDLNADVRLRAFDTEFHVHSVILKIHSAFFKFLNSADKTAVLANSTPVGGFKYEWVTKIDEGGSWSLVAKGNQDENVQTENLEKFDGDKNKEVEALEKLVQAFYAEPYKLKSADDLRRMTQLADYYCALPALSNTISLPFFRGDIQVRIYCVSLISTSMKLHHADLFRECVIWIVGCWADYAADWELSKLDPKIQKTIQNARNRIGAWVAEVHEKLLYINEHGGQDLVSRLAGIKYSRNALPQYFREIDTLYWGDGENWGRYDDIDIALETVLKNNLLYAGSKHEAGGEHFPDYFFCATVDDDDLPWDRTQTDW